MVTDTLVNAPAASCRVCANIDGNRAFFVREMMFGRREAFEYLECAECGCVQIKDIPHELWRYYPAAYHGPRSLKLARPSIRRSLKRVRAKYCLTGSGLVGHAVTALAGRPRANVFGRPDHYEWFRRCGVGFDSAILDVGCGAGALLEQMHHEGFSNLTGLDAFIDESIDMRPALQIIKGDIFGLSGSYDLIMLHHTFEHMAEPHRVLRRLNQLLNPNRYLLLRIPVASSFAYRRYAENWAQLDAPRHLFVHSVDSIRRLAAGSGFECESVVFDSNDFQFWASEQYTRDIPLHDDRSYLTSPENSIFSPDEIAAFRRSAEDLNRKGEGDSACFYLRKVASVGEQVLPIV